MCLDWYALTIFFLHRAFCLLVLFQCLVSDLEYVSRFFIRVCPFGGCSLTFIYIQRLGSPPFFCGVSVVHLFSFLRCDFALFWLSSFCILCPMLSVSLDFPFLIALLVSSNVLITVE